MSLTWEDYEKYMTAEHMAKVNKPTHFSNGVRRHPSNSQLRELERKFNHDTRRAKRTGN